MAVRTQAPWIEQAVPGVARGRRPRRTQRTAYLFLLPMLVSAVIFTVIPFFYTLYLSMTNWSIRRFLDYDFIGLRNYERIFELSGAFVPVLRWTFIWMFSTTVINIGGGMLLALLLNHPGLRERNLYRTILILPWALPNILLLQVWAGIFNTQGPLNLLLSHVGIERINWLSEIYPARAALLITNLWLSYPFFMTVGLAALQAIPRDLYEVADLDGAGWWPRFRDITFPFLLGAITPLVVTQLAFQFNNAGMIFLLTQGNPPAFPGARYGATDTLTTYAYRLIWDIRNYGLSAAYGVVVFLFIAVFTILSAKLTGSFKETE